MEQAKLQIWSQKMIRLEMPDATRIYAEQQCLGVGGSMAAERRYILVIVFSMPANFLLYAAVGSKLWSRWGEKYR
jgi:hypothetical protein